MLGQETTSRESHCDDFNPRFLWHFLGHPNDRPFIQSSCATHKDPVRHTLFHQHSNFSNYMNVLSNNFLFPVLDAAPIQHRPQTTPSSYSPPSAPLHWCYSAFLFNGMAFVALGNILQGQHCFCLPYYLTIKLRDSFWGTMPAANIRNVNFDPSSKVLLVSIKRLLLS